MAKTQGIVRLRGSIDGVTYTEGIYGRLSRSKSSLTKAKMNANPKFDTLRLLQSELGAYSKFGALLRSGIKTELARIKSYRGVQRLNKILNQLKNEDTVNRLGQRQVSEGLVSPKGKALLNGFDFYGKSSVYSLLTKNFSIDETTGETSILNFLPMYDLIAPRTATHVAFKLVLLGIDGSDLLVQNSRSAELYFGLHDAAFDLVLTPESPPDAAAFHFYLVQIVFYNEINGFKELIAYDSAALSIIKIV
nr:hypothetical protein [uncultured Flavobacterium sp.]